MVSKASGGFVEVHDACNASTGPFAAGEITMGFFRMSKTI